MYQQENPNPPLPSVFQFSFWQMSTKITIQSLNDIVEDLITKEIKTEKPEEC
jgi:hypothetical protein